MRREMWFAAQEDDEPDDEPDTTPEPMMNATEIRVGFLFVLPVTAY